MQKRLIFILVGIFSLFPSVYADEDTTVPTLDYIRTTSDGVYHLYCKNIPTDWDYVNFYVDGAKIEKSNVIFTKDGADIRNLYGNARTFLIERLKKNTSTTGTITYSVDKSTELIKVWNNDNVGLNGKAIHETKNDYEVVTLPFVAPISLDGTNISQSELQAKRKLLINGQENALVPFMGEYKEGIYYITTSGITFIEKNLTAQMNIIGLRFDGLLSSYINIKKGGITLDVPMGVEIEDAGTTKNLKILFPEPKNFNNLAKKEIYVNGSKIDNSNVTLGLNRLVIRYDIAKLTKDQDNLSVFLKDTSNNTYSNEQIVSVANYSKLLITSIDTGKGDTPLFTFSIKGNMNALFGDMYKFRININGTDYTREGTKEYIKNTSGSVEKDSSGNNRYEMKNKIEFRKTSTGLEFEFGYNNLKDGENVLFLKNDNSGRESNRVLFFKKNDKPVDYNYLAGTTLNDSKKKELLTFEIGKDFEKKVNPANMTTNDRNVSLGKLNLSNLKSNGYYSIDFTIDTNLTVNPFSSLKLDSTNLETVKNGDSLSFVFQKRGFGKDITTNNELIATINELYVVDKAFALTINELSLKILTTDNTFETIASTKNPMKANMSYSYNKSTCFDGTKDFCSLIKEVDPILSIQYSASGAPLVSTVETPTSTTTTTETGSTSIKKNVSIIVAQNFGNEKFKKVQTLLVAKYEALRKKGSIYVPTFRKATNTLLLALRNYELKVNQTDCIVQIKSALGTINEVLKKAKKE